ncbi:MAG: pyridoxal phosphate-dependent class II aminotransferase [Desulfobacterium sp.]|nr:pyridoxal phosphate-dependent class II aminotransferase [Desulfobacterium sp.]
MITGHGGNVNALAERLGCSIDDIIDMSSNLNPLGPPPGLEAFLAENMGKIRSLPQADAREMVNAFSRRYDVDGNRVMAGNGTTWFLYTLPLALKTRKMLILGPTYSDYRDGCVMHGVAYDYVLSTADTLFAPDLDSVSQKLATGSFDTMVICNPNNPTGAMVEKEAILALVREYPHIRFVVDESYLPFVDHAEAISLVGEDRFPNLMVLSSMSKIFRIPGLRTGFLCADPSVIEGFMHYYQPWSVNALAQAAVIHLLDNKRDTEAFTLETRRFTATEKERFKLSLADCPGLRLFPSHAYFLLAGLDPSIPAGELCQRMGDGRILIRDCTNFDGLSNQFVRFSLKTREINTKLSLGLTKHLTLLKG